MRLKKVAEQLSNELRIHLTLSRLLRYSERGILPRPTYDDKQIRDYSLQDVDRLRATIVLAELGVPLPDVRLFHQDPQSNRLDIQRRIDVVKGLTIKAEELLRNALQVRSRATN